MDVTALTDYMCTALVACAITSLVFISRATGIPTWHGNSQRRKMGKIDLTREGEGE